MQQRLVSLSVDAHASSGISRIPLFGLSGRTLAQRVWYGIDHLASALKTNAQGTPFAKIHEPPTRLDLGLRINVEADHSVKFDA